MQTSVENKILAIIPARYASTRFPGKPLAEIAGKPMIQHVWEQVRKTCRIDEVLIATDDQRIFDAAQDFGAEAVMTRSDHQTGTDRMVEVVKQKNCRWVMNVQGDEPLIFPDDLDRLIEKAEADAETKAATLIFPISDPEKLQNPNIVKVVLNQKNQSLYFSRSLIPFPRSEQDREFPVWRHLGVYMFRRDFLLEFHQWPQTPLEKLEQLEQLRILENGETLLCVEAESEGVGVDMPEDIEIAEKILIESQNTASSI